MNDEAAVRLLQGLVEHPSPSGNVEAARAFLVDELQDLGLTPRVDDAGNVRATTGSGPVRVLLCGHLDTVPGGPEARLRDGVLHGRGSVDAKGPLACFVAAMHRHRGSQDLTLELAAVPDEETTSHGARHLATSVDADHVIVGEPSGARGITLGYRGCVRFTYTVGDAPRHGGTPHSTPADRVHAYWEQVRSFCAGHEGESLFFTASPVLQELQTDHAGNQVEAWLTGNVRTPPGFPTDELLRHLKEHAGDGDLRVTGAEEPVLGDRRNPLVRAFLGSIREGGRRPRLVRKTGTSDLNVLAPALGVPAVAYGPGDSRMDHTPHEHVEVQEVLEAVRVLTGALARLGARHG